MIQPCHSADIFREPPFPVEDHGEEVDSENADNPKGRHLADITRLKEHFCQLHHISELVNHMNLRYWAIAGTAANVLSIAS